MGTNMAARNQQKHHSVTEFCYKSVNLSLKELKNFALKNTFSNIRTVQIAKFPETRGLEALTRMLFFKFSEIIIGFCVKSEVQ